jgi:hypothetical protein
MTPPVFLLRIDDARNMRRFYRPPVPRACKNKIRNFTAQTAASFVSFYIKRYSDLQERWYGRPGGAGEYAASLLQSPAGDEGKIAYVAVAESAWNSRPIRPSCSAFPASPCAPDRSLRRAPTRAGLTNHDWNVLMFYARAALDRNGVMFTAKRGRALLPDDVSVEPYRAGVGFAIQALDFRLEAGKQVGGALEHFEVFDHRPRPRA